MRTTPFIAAALLAGSFGAVSYFARPTAASHIAAADPAASVADSSGETPTFGDETSAAEDEIPGEIAVDLRDDATPADVADLDSRYGLTMRPNTAWSARHDKLEVADVGASREASLLQVLSRDPRVQHAEPMAVYHATFAPNDPLYATKQWHIKRVGAETAWRYSCGRQVTVAVVDTGVACFDKGPFSRGTDLAGTRCGGGWNFVDDTADAYDDQGHGTHVAGTIAQTTNNGVGTAGLAFCATLMPVKVLNRQGFGTVANVAEGIRFAADNGAQVINLSLGGPIKSQILQDAVEHAIDEGVVVVAAAGNSGKKVGWPAAYPGVIAVSATDPNDKIASFSSRGPEVAIAAPGVAVTQQTVCNGGRDKCEIFGTFNGTSMASPHVAGAAALVEAMGVTDARAVRADLTASARPKGDKELYGAGIVDAGAAVSRAFWAHLALRALALVSLWWAIARQIRRRGGVMSRSAGAVVGALAAAVGVLPIAPLLGFPVHGGGALTELLMRPIGEWDLVFFGIRAHGWLLFASALPALGLAAVGFGVRKARPFIGGVALGTAALLMAMAWSGDVAFVGGRVLLRLWAVANALVCVWLARAALDVRRSGPLGASRRG